MNGRPSAELTTKGHKRGAFPSRPTADGPYRPGVLQKPAHRWLRRACWVGLICWALTRSQLTAGEPTFPFPFTDPVNAAVDPPSGSLDRFYPLDAISGSSFLQLTTQRPTDNVATLDDPVSRIDRLEAEIRELKTAVLAPQEIIDELPADGIEIGGAVRFQYSMDDYSAGNRERGGDMDFDIFRLDLDGRIGDIQLSAQYRWFQYMHVIQKAWVGYSFNPQWQCQLGITRVPFGNLPYNAHNYFFSTNFYVGLEDDYDAGIKLVGQDESHDFRLGFFVTDEQGGVDGFVDNRTDRYAYDVVGVRAPAEGIFDAPATEIAEHNALVFRYVYKFPSVDVGSSLIYGDLRDANGSVGDRLAYAFHANCNFDRWNIQFQLTDYDYQVDSGNGLLVVGAYSFFDTIPEKARIYTGNIAYALPVQLGPISELLFYNDYNFMTEKSGGLIEDTIMNVTGVAVTAGGLYTYIDLIAAKNQPFIGSSIAADDDDWNTRFNVNVGFYF